MWDILFVSHFIFGTAAYIQCIFVISLVFRFFLRNEKWTTSKKNIISTALGFLFFTALFTGMEIAFSPRSLFADGLVTFLYTRLPLIIAALCVYAVLTFFTKKNSP